MGLLVIQWANALNVIGFSFAMVFCLLVLIILVLSVFGKVITFMDKASQNQGKKNPKLSAGSGKERVVSEKPADDMSADEIAAIGLALCSYFSDVHDQESNILTVKKVSKLYSPWSSKIYGLNTLTK
jgi:glutaconyl-CoA/methylmalonyl-CoA decarboxylase subunit delta